MSAEQTRKLIALAAIWAALLLAPYWMVPLGGYTALPADRHLIAYLRGTDVLAVATRLPYGLEQRGGWQHGHAIDLPDGDWTDLLTGRAGLTGRVGPADLLTTLPVALLLRSPH